MEQALRNTVERISEINQFEFQLLIFLFILLAVPNRVGQMVSNPYHIYTILSKYAFVI